MLEAKEVVKSFDGFRALDSATLTVPKGTAGSNRAICSCPNRDASNRVMRFILSTR